MTITGEMLIGARAVRGQGGEIRGVEAATGAALDPPFAGATPADVDAACRLADAAFDTYRETPPEVRARFLDAIADNLQAVGAEIVERAMAESGLPRPRLEGELGRTMGQLRMFAAVVRDGHYLDARIDPAMPDRKPMPRVDLRLRNVALGPVAVFGASNFPLAFSVAGGDTASALAAGCPVVAKAHNAHPGTSELAGRAVQKAVADAGLPEGVFSLLFDADIAVGQALVAHPAIKAVGFTGSRRGGLALLKIAQDREEPIPVYAEMSAINPVVLMPAALDARATEIGRAYVGALTLGAGQFCTNPGIVIGVEGPGLDTFLAAAGEAVMQGAGGDHADARHPPGLLRGRGAACVARGGRGRGPRRRGRREPGPGGRLRHERRGLHVGQGAAGRGVRRGLGGRALPGRRGGEGGAGRSRGPAHHRRPRRRRRPRGGPAAAAGAGAQGRADRLERLRNRRRGGPRHGPRRPLAGDLRRPLDLGGLAGDPQVPAAGELPGRAGRPAPGGAAGRQSGRPAATGRRGRAEGLGASDLPLRDIPVSRREDRDAFCALRC
ncbi:aldehyde dehydrogenase family protein [Phenylobacterium sp. J367]|uniref:aldehyde dehydrogenase family protein n=1 Tax=Phenylobacterium sp. J367 TaxID=2898435 RepID=UPI0027E3386A|nr:aldehyde dehydrogenase family protein [Phenylobacterium sp. J367]